MAGGFQVSRSVGAGENTGKVRRYYVDAAHASIIAPGDVVKLTGSADADGVAAVDRATSGGVIAGVVASVEYRFAGEALGDTALPASTAGYVFVHTDTDLEFEVDCDETLAVADVGLNASPDWVVASKTGGITVTNVKLDGSTKATTAALQFRITGLLPDAAGVLGNRATVTINASALSGTGV
jgi:hypothetical protein